MDVGWIKLSESIISKNHLYKNGHCEELSDEAISFFQASEARLLRHCVPFHEPELTGGGSNGGCALTLALSPKGRGDYLPFPALRERGRGGVA